MIIISFFYYSVIKNQIDESFEKAYNDEKECDLMEHLEIKKGVERDTYTIDELGMLAFRVFPEQGILNIQLLAGAQEEYNIPFVDGEIVEMKDVVVQLKIVD